MNNLVIVYEDDFMLVVDKQAGIVVNRSETTRETTIQDMLGGYLKLGKSLGIGDRAGIVHRLDRETSGLLLVAKTQAAFENLQSQFKGRLIKKEYVALVHGRIEGETGNIDQPIGRVGGFGKFGVTPGGRESKTVFSVSGHFKIKEEIFEKISEGENKNRKKYLVNNAGTYTFLELYPETGRTHQIRVHLKSIGHPIVSDLIYAPHKLIKFDLLWCERLFLHARSLEVTHPDTHKRIFFESGLPDDLVRALERLQSTSLK